MTSPDVSFDVVAKDKATPTFDKIGKKSDGLGSKLGDFAKRGGVAMAAFAAAGAAAVTAIGAAGASFALEKSKTDTLLAGQVGAFGQVKELGKVTGALYVQGWAESAGQAADAVRATIQQKLIDPDAGADAIKAMSTRTAALAALMQQDVDRVAGAVATMLRTGIARNAEEAFDLLTVATQKGIDKSQDLLDTMIEYSIQFKTLGIDAPKALGLMSQALGAGARHADVAADAIKEFAIRSRDNSKLSAQAFTSLGLDADKMFQVFARGGPQADAAMKQVIDRLKAMTDPVKRNETAVALFGTKAEDLQDALFAFDPTTAVAALGEVTGASKAFIDSQSSAGQRLDQIWRGILTAVADNLLPTIENALGGFEEFGDGAIESIDKLAVRIDTFIEDNIKPLEGSFNQFKDTSLKGLDLGFGNLTRSLESAGVQASTFRDIMNVLLPVFGFLAAAFLVIQAAIVGAFILPIVAAIKVVETLIKVVKNATEGWQKLIDKIRGTSGGGAIFGAITRNSASGPQARAHGGPVTAGRPYIVGDGGRPELFVPDQSGTILPSVPSAVSGGGGGTNVIELRATGFNDSVMGRMFLSWLQGALRANPGVRLTTA